MYEYGIIQQNGYFGDISILTNQPSEYAYFYNPQYATTLLYLDANEFMKILKDHPVTKEHLVERAKQR